MFHRSQVVSDEQYRSAAHDGAEKAFVDERLGSMSIDRAEDVVEQNILHSRINGTACSGTAMSAE